ncbi:MAG: hypothetical protein PHC61_17085 [Chitinivibrionales bacterium]|nr:hypothetical protein [Chitinivibrionales bacterium]
MKKLMIAAIACCALFSAVFSQEPKASQPTHYFLGPTPQVNNLYDFVFSLHEISLGLGSGLQVQASLLDNIAGVDLGIKYALSPTMALGGGLAHSLVDAGNWWHNDYYYNYPDFYGLGAFLACGLANSKNLQMTITPNVQINGYGIGVGGIFSLMSTPAPVWSLIGEGSFSFVIPAPFVNFILDGGLRIHPPQIPFLSFDLGLAFDWWAGPDHYSYMGASFNPVHPQGYSISPYFDFILAFAFNK